MRTLFTVVLSLTALLTPSAPASEPTPRKPHPILAHHHKVVRHHWRHAWLLVTNYVVNKNDHGCTTNHNATSSQTHAQRGTIAVDTARFPFGTKFLIPHYGYGIARDRGGLVKRDHIDAAVMSCKAALNWGVPYLLVSYELPSSSHR